MLLTFSKFVALLTFSKFEDEITIWTSVNTCRKVVVLEWNSSYFMVLLVTLQ